MKARETQLAQISKSKTPKPRCPNINVEKGHARPGDDNMRCLVTNV